MKQTRSDTLRIAFCLSARQRAIASCYSCLHHSSTVVVQHSGSHHPGKIPHYLSGMSEPRHFWFATPIDEEKAVQFAAEVSNWFAALEAAHNEVTPQDLWKGTKTVLLEVARETIGSVKSQKKNKWISDDTYAVIREKTEAKLQKAKIRTDIKNWRQRYRKNLEWINSSSWKACVRN